MTVLLDTHTFIWLYDSPERLPVSARQILDDNKTTLLVSIATLWEMAIKKCIGKLKTRHTIPYIVEIHHDLIRFLPIEIHHIALVESLPLHHRDPFDRLIIAQALTENLPIMSNDTIFDVYGVQRIWE